MDDTKQKEIFSRNLLRYIGDTPQSEIAKAIGVSPQTFNTWCQRKAMPRAGKLQALADYFGIYKSDLIEEKNESKAPVAPLSKEETLLVSGFNSLSPDHQQSILEHIASLKALESQSGGGDLKN